MTLSILISNGSLSSLGKYYNFQIWESTRLVVERNEHSLMDSYISLFVPLPPPPSSPTISLQPMNDRSLE